MSENKESSKYWIEPGRYVERIVGPTIIFTVDEVLKEKLSETRVITKGVKVHWITDHGIYQEGVLRTDELRPHIQISEHRT
jgi:hypothetical protein